jgi:DNA-binding MarR family transcriptional regulator
LIDMAATKVRTCVCGLLQRTTRCLTRFYDHALQPSGLRTSQYSMLAHIDRDGPLSIGDLGRLLRMDQSTAVRNVSVLRRDGLLKITPEKGGRRKMVALTPKGRGRMAEATPYWDTAQSRVEAALGREALALLNEVTERLQVVAGRESERGEEAT